MEVSAADAQNAAADAIKTSRNLVGLRIKPANLFIVPSEKFTVEIFKGMAAYCQ